MTISLTQMAEIARILGYPNISPQSSLQPHYPDFSSQFAMWQPYAMLLNRLAACSSDDEVQMLGAESALFGSKFIPSSVAIVFALSGSGVTQGAAYKLNAGNVSFAYTAQETDTVASIAAQFAAQIADDPTASEQLMPNALGGTLTLYNIQALGADGNGVQCAAATNDPNVTVSFGGAAGAFANGCTAGGTSPNGPRYTDITSGETIFGYVPIIHVLESDLINSRQNLDTKSAAEWNPRQDELDVRWALKQQYCRELANRISVPLYPDIVGNNSGVAQRIR